MGAWNRAFDDAEGIDYDRTAGWSSLVARWAHNPKVGGSNPPPATKSHRKQIRNKQEKGNRLRFPFERPESGGKTSEFSTEPVRAWLQLSIPALHACGIVLVSLPHPANQFH